MANKMFIERLGAKLHQFTVEGKTDKEWRSMSDEELMETKSYKDYLEWYNERISNETYSGRRDGKKTSAQERALESIKKKIRFMETETDAWGASITNQERWLVARERGDEKEWNDILRKYIKDMQWSKLVCTFSGGHDSGCVEKVYAVIVNDKGKIEQIPLSDERFTLYSAHIWSRDGGTEEDIKAAEEKMFQEEWLNMKSLRNNQYPGTMSPTYLPLRANFGSWANHPSTNGTITFYPYDEDEENYEPYEIQYEVYGEYY
nr:hypothetical protein [uncultured Mediterranean phage uvMED]